ncbi:hypothetical protein OG985_44045 [Streptomyces sp. NBC_00289]|uniref:hypothetical protein n=1 Tax=Streptomyces sp. NBC_00289 TaxID=2975703 RepID=UPI003245E5BB
MTGSTYLPRSKAPCAATSASTGGCARWIGADGPGGMVRYAAPVDRGVLLVVSVVLPTTGIGTSEPAVIWA